MDEVRTTVDIDGGILMGHDGSECAQEALRWAAGLAARTRWPLHVLRAWQLTTAPQPATWTYGYVPPLTDYEQAVHDELRAHVAAAGIDVEGVVSHVVHRPPVPGLIEAAAGADLLVMGARGRGGFRGLVLGSVSDQCVHRAPCPVTVVRSGVQRARART